MKRIPSSVHSGKMKMTSMEEIRLHEQKIPPAMRFKHVNYRKLTSSHSVYGK